MNWVHEQCPKILLWKNTESNWAKNRLSAPSAQPAGLVARSAARPCHAPGAPLPRACRALLVPPHPRACRLRAPYEPAKCLQACRSCPTRPPACAPARPPTCVPQRSPACTPQRPVPPSAVRLRLPAHPYAPVPARLHLPTAPAQRPFLRPPWSQYKLRQ